MSRSRIFILTLLVVGAGWAAGPLLGSGYVAHWKAKRVRSTTFVSAGNRRLTGFFDGMRPDPNWAARKVAMARLPAQGCHPSLSRSSGSLSNAQCMRRAAQATLTRLATPPVAMATVVITFP